MQGALEREAKFEFADETPMPDLAGVVAGVTVVPRPEVELVSTYFDTPDLRLLRRGVTVRYRRQAGSGDGTWTLKLPTGTGHATYDRTELSWPGGAADLPGEVSGLTRGLTRGSDLVGVAEMTTLRRRVELVDGAGRRLAEVDDDRVRVAQPAAAEFRQVEVELDAGDDSLVAAVERRLTDAGAVCKRDDLKLRLALGGDQVTASRCPLGRESRVGEVISASLVAGLDRLLDHDAGVRLDADPEFVHQARVATRRLRSDLKTFAAALDRRWVDATRAELEWLGASLGEVRDDDVLGQRLSAMAAASAGVDAGAFNELSAELAVQRQAGRQRLVTSLDSPRYLALLATLEAAAAAPPYRSREGKGSKTLRPESPAVAVLGPLVAKPWRKLRRAVEELGADPSNEALHGVRIRAKRLRYASEAAAPVIGKPAQKLARAAEDLQTALGEHHDAVGAESWLRRVAATGSTAQVFAAGQAVVWERQAQDAWRRRWPPAWKHLRARRLRAWTA